MDSGQRGIMDGEPRAAADFTAGAPYLRLAIGLGDPERERVLLQELTASGDIVVTERCLTADQLLACAQQRTVDAALVAFDLHRLRRDALSELIRTTTPLVLLTPEGSTDQWRTFPGAVLPLDADEKSIRQALQAIVRGERPGVSVFSDDREMEHVATNVAAPSEPTSPNSTVITLASGHGSPGRTTIAVSLAVALGTAAPTVLVDADLNGPSITAHLDADPTRNLSMLIHAGPETTREWDRAIAQETQPLTLDVPQCAVLSGIPKPMMRSQVSGRFFEQLIAELQRRYRYVILDTGSDFLGSDAGIHRLALSLAHHVLFIVSADLPGLWHARSTLNVMRTHLHTDPDRTALIINRHDRRYHHTRSEIEWALGMPAGAVIPYDHTAVQRALTEQRPLILDRRSRAGRAVLELAECVQGGSIAVSPEQPKPGRASRQRWAPAVQNTWLLRRAIKKTAE